MAIAKMILEYLRVVVWPLLILFGLLFFRDEIRALVRSIQKMRLPGGTELSWHTLPDEAKKERLDADVALALPGAAEAAAVAAAPSDHPAPVVPENRVRERVQQAEALVMQQLEAQYRVKVQRQVTIDSRPDFQFDGIFEHDGRITLVEVKYIMSDKGAWDHVDAIMSLFEKVRAAWRTDRVAGLLVLVADMPDDKRQVLDRSVSGHVATRWRHHQVRVYGFEQLRLLHGGDGKR